MRLRRVSLLGAVLEALVVCGCGGSSSPPAAVDGGHDSAVSDGAGLDSTQTDSGSPPDSSVDSTVSDTAVADSGVDSGLDSGIDSTVADTGTSDTSAADSAPADTGMEDTSMPDSGGPADTGVGADTSVEDSGMVLGDTGAAETGPADSGGDTGTSATFTVGGTVAGLAAGDTLTLQDNGGNNLPLTASGAFTFTGALATGAPYAVSVLSVTGPASQACTVANASGQIGSANVTNVQVSCTTSDGVLSVAAGQTFNLGLSTVGANGRSLPDGVSYPVVGNLPAGQSTATVASAPAGIATGDQVLVVTLVDTPVTAGTNETALVQSVSGNTLTFTAPLANTYHGTIEVLRVPAYASVSVAAGGTVTAPRLSAGVGGVLALRSAGTVQVDGVVTASQIGFAGGTAAHGPLTAWGTLSAPTAPGAGGSFVCGQSFAPGGGGVTQDGFNNTCGPEVSGPGGAGITGGTWPGSVAALPGTPGDNGPGAAGGKGVGAGGGGGGGSCTASGAAELSNGGTGGVGGAGGVPGQGGIGGGGGGGGGAPFCGSGTGAAGGAGGSGQNSAANMAAAMPSLLQLGAGSGYGGGGGGGGAANGSVGNAGTGGGAGGHSFSGPTAGGASGTLNSTSAPGGGAIYIVAPKIVVTGAITADGGPGGAGGAGGAGRTGNCGGSGGGGGGAGGAGAAGGAVLLNAPQITLGAGLVHALGGLGGAAGTRGAVGPGGCNGVSTSNNGGGGGAGGAGAPGTAGAVVVVGTPTGSTMPAFVVGGTTFSCTNSQAAPAPTCAALHAQCPALTTGSYWLDPPGTATAYQAACDMTTAGGGWTRVFLENNTMDLDSASIDYAIDDPNLRLASSTVLTGYLSNAGAVVGHLATWPITENWVDQSPFLYLGSQNDEFVTVSIDGASSFTQTLRYGYSGWGSLCTDPWAPASSLGRICVEGTTAPFFGGWAAASMDSCVNSTQPASASTCVAATDNFFIALR